MASVETEQDHIAAFSRAARRVGAALKAETRAARARDLDRAAKALAKRTSQRAADMVQDRHQRQRARAELYNAFTPVLRELGERQSQASLRTLRLLLACAIFGLIGFLAGVLV